MRVKQPLDAEQRKLWYACVHAQAPQGVLFHTQIPQKGELTNSSYYHKKLKNCHEYVIPLLRDLVHHEVYQIAHGWDSKFPDSDFIIDYSQPADHVPPTDTDVPAHKISQVLDAWGKQEHDVWMQDKLDKGWRYGIKLSVKDRTHPWIQPWESLPEQARETKTESVKKLLHLLDDFGYVIKQKPEA